MGWSRRAYSRAGAQAILGEPWLCFPRGSLSSPAFCTSVLANFSCLQLAQSEEASEEGCTRVPYC